MIGGAVITVSNILMLLTIVFATAGVFVNGFTDAPNAIACAVSTGSLSKKSAVRLAAFFDMLGIITVSVIGARVANTITTLANFDYHDHRMSAAAFISAIMGVVVWSVVAWRFAIPTSESHALIAGISGAAIALNGLGGINTQSSVKVGIGLVISTVAGFAFGFLSLKIGKRIKFKDSKKEDRIYRRGQRISAAAMSFFHGAQDGQKFASVFVIGMFLSKSIPVPSSIKLTDYIWVLLICGVVLAAGVSLGGFRIIDTIGNKMIKLDIKQGFYSDLSGSICLFAATVAGIPLSTTHTKVMAIMGVGAASDNGKIDKGVAVRLCITWILTFPVCAAIGFLLTKLFGMLI